jgi:hypothetical protein
MDNNLIERFKSACKLMAEKMPEKFRFVIGADVWQLQAKLNANTDIIYFNGQDAECTQDNIDTLASFLPEPRRFLLCDLIWDLDVEHNVFIGNMIGFYTKTFSMNWKFKYCESMIMQKEPLEAKIEIFCMEAERQLGK